MKAFCLHGRPWFRCGECSGETCSPGSGEKSEMYTLMMTSLPLVDTPTSRHLAAMRAERDRRSREQREWMRKHWYGESVRWRILSIGGWPVPVPDFVVRDSDG